MSQMTWNRYTAILLWRDCVCVSNNNPCCHNVPAEFEGKWYFLGVHRTSWFPISNEALNLERWKGRARPLCPVAGLCPVSGLVRAGLGHQWRPVRRWGRAGYWPGPLTLMLTGGQAPVWSWHGHGTNITINMSRLKLMTAAMWTRSLCHL